MRVSTVLSGVAAMATVASAALNRTEVADPRLCGPHMHIKLEPLIEEIMFVVSLPFRFILVHLATD
jgi:hypothetical protein